MYGNNSKMATREHRNWEFGKVSALCRIIEVKCSGLCFCEKFISAKHMEFGSTQPRILLSKFREGIHRIGPFLTPLLADPARF